MNRNVSAAIVMIAIFACAQCLHDAQAQTPLPAAPVTGWCYDSFSTPNYNGVKACPDAPPPITDVDPLGMNSIFGRFASHLCPSVTTNNGQDFGALFGQSEGGLPIVPLFPWRQNSIFWQIPPTKRYSAVQRMPMNPGTRRVFMKADAYGGCGLAAVGTFDWSVVKTNAQDADPTGKCSGTSFFGDRSSFLGINPSNAVATDNPTMCNYRFGKAYRLIIDPRMNSVASVIFTVY